MWRVVYAQSSCRGHYRLNWTFKVLRYPKINMGTWNIAHQNKLLFICSRTYSLCSRRMLNPILNSRIYCQLVFYHATNCFLSTKDWSVKPVVKRRHSVLNNCGVHMPVLSNRRIFCDASASRKAWAKKIPVSQQKKTQGDRRVSSELRKLSLEDFTADREKPIRENAAKQDQEEKSYDIVFGISPCLFAITQARRKAYKLFVKEGESAQRASVLKICEEAHRRGVLIHWVGKKELDRMSSGRVHQGVCLQASCITYVTEQCAYTPLRTSGKIPLWLVLDSIQDPMNLGAILRSAYYLGVDRVLSSLSNSCPLTPVVSKASSGVMEIISVYGYESLEELLKLKLSHGWHAVGTVGAEANSQVTVTQCSDFNMTKPTLLLMGSEGEGLSPHLLSYCETLLTIPAGRDLLPGIESLNVSVATGILLHSLLSSKGTGH